MRRLNKFSVRSSYLAFVVVSLLALNLQARAKGLALQGQPFKRVVYVVLENTNFSASLKQPFMSKLAKDGALLNKMYAEIHPSQGNYIAMITGTDLGIKSDSQKDLDVKHIGDLLEAKGMTWKVYAEKYPGKCFLGMSANGYFRKHNPFISMVNVQNDPKRCANIVSQSEFDSDVQSASLPDYSFYVPDIKNDGHDTGVAFADKWLANKFGPLLTDPKFIQDTLLVITFDENDGSPGNQIYTVLYGSGIKPGSVSDVRYDHYSLLRLVEDVFGLGNLGQKDTQAAPINDVWN